MIRYKRGEYAAAEAAFQAGLKSEPKNLHLLIGLSLARLARGDRAQAHEIVDRVAALADGDRETEEMVAGVRRMLQEGAPQ
jgi:thioredoxin-like negative regulator of GroEL